jgi:hypothetical protein
VTDDDLRRSAVVILSDVDVPAALARPLARFDEDGGGLFVATGSRTTRPADLTGGQTARLRPANRDRNEYRGFR